MIRESYASKYNEEVHGIIHELFNVCKMTMVHSGDLLVCQQNGFIGFGSSCLGPGEIGLNYYQQLNWKIGACCYSRLSFFQRVNNLNRSLGAFSGR